MSRRHALMRVMQINGGLRADDAAKAADIAIQMMRKERNKIIRMARQSGLSYRQIGRALGISHTQVIRVVHHGSNHVPPASTKLPAAEQGSR